MEIWDQFQSQLEKQLGRDTVERWIKPLKLLRFDAANIYLQAHDSFQAAWFEEHARPLCSKLVNNNGRPVRVVLYCEGSDSSSKKPDLTSSATTLSSINRPAKGAVPMNQTASKFEIESSPFLILPDVLDPDMTLEHFIAHKPCNEMAFKVVMSCTENLFNPILLYGPKGSGKTHLLMSAALLLKQKNKKVFYVSATTFMEHVIQGMRKGSMKAVRSAYREADALLVDDIHLFSRKAATQEEFFHTFNDLHIRGCPILLTSQYSPSHLSEIEPRLVSRFEWGLTTTLEPEDPTNVLKKKAELWKLSIEPSLVSYLVEKFPSSSLSALQALAMRAKDTSRVGPNLAAVILKDLLEKQALNEWTAEKIIKSVAAQYGIRSADIIGKSQARETVLPRQIAMYICRDKLKFPFKKLGEIFGRDHSTVMAAVRQIQEGLLKQKAELSEPISEIIYQLQKDIPGP